MISYSAGSMPYFSINYLSCSYYACEGNYILKPQFDDYRSKPESEHLVMSMADVCGIATVPHALIQNDGTVAQHHERADRIIQGDRVS